MTPRRPTYAERYADPRPNLSHAMAGPFTVATWTDPTGKEWFYRIMYRGKEASTGALGRD